MENKSPNLQGAVPIAAAKKDFLERCALVSESVSWNGTHLPRMVVPDVCDRHSELAGASRNTPCSKIVHLVHDYVLLSQ